MTNANPSSSGSKKPRSPWMWVGLGCGVTILLTFGGCVALLGFFGNRAVQEISKPLDQKELLAKLGDAPIYQPSTFNEVMTKGARFGSSLFPGEMFSAAAFDTSDQPNQVIGWYQQQLTERGYQKQPGQSHSDSKITQASFQRGSESIIVQIQEATSATSPQKYTFLLMRMKPPTAKEPS
jgi:hypothetical protein